ncbi:hypothetical protein N7G274_010639 [Stereocaulon virgatum]|uniref:Ribosomal protein L1 n=1 Tax=Stereocaulon virgatum TaxID=373712 RepID=A0ABR3ZTV4_9LECA
MAPKSTALTTRVESGSPYQLDRDQTLRASSALLKHIKTFSQRKEASATTKNLLITDPTSPDNSVSEVEPIWLVLSAKKFITDKQQLKPRKVALPHSLNTSPNTSICLITPDPQRQFKDAIAHPSFPPDLAKRITKVISIKKLEAKCHSFEAKRQLRDSYDIFLADDRIISYLAKNLGKTFYKTTPKRPIPVNLRPPKPKEKKNAALPSTKPKKEPTDPSSLIAPPQIAKEIQRTLSTAQIHLHPSTTTSVKVGLASFTPEQVAANIEAVVAGLTDKLIAWRNVRAVHIKGPNTMALPIWLAEELWTDEGMILEDDEAAEAKAKAAQKGKKRKQGALEGSTNGGEEVLVKGTKRKEVDGVSKEEAAGESRRKKARRLAEEEMSKEMKERREKLRQQKKEARQMIEEKGAVEGERVDVESVVKETRKSKKAIEAV